MLVVNVFIACLNTPSEIKLIASQKNNKFLSKKYPVFIKNIISSIEPKIKM